MAAGVSFFPWRPGSPRQLIGTETPPPRSAQLDTWQFYLQPFGWGDEYGERLYLDQVESYARYNARYMGRLPRLYDTHVRYLAEQPPAPGLPPPQTFRDAMTAYVRGFDHCPGLAAWRLAELRAQGIPAIATLDRGKKYYHAVILRVLPGGGLGVEDPSRRLGMP